MTPKEWAWRLHTAISESKDESPLAVIAIIEDTIRTVIEEEREACAKIVEEGSESDYAALTDHRFQRGGPLGLCKCGLQKEAHPGNHRMTRKQIVKAIHARGEQQSKGD